MMETKMEDFKFKFMDSSILSLDEKMIKSEVAQKEKLGDEWINFLERETSVSFNILFKFLMRCFFGCTQNQVLCLWPPKYSST